MSGDCENCGEHTMCCRCVVNRSIGPCCKKCKNEKIACTCMGRALVKKKETSSKVDVEVKDLAELVFWARRYCDGRATYAPFSFNQVYKRIREIHPSVITSDTFDHTLTESGLHWPFAQDGMYNAQTGAFDATY